MTDAIVLQTPHGPVRLEMRNPKTLNPAPFNVMAHSEEEVARLTTSVGAHGFLEVPLYNERTDRIVAGHARQQAAIANKLDAIPVFVGEWDEQTEQALTIALQGKQYGEWDDDTLKEVLDDLKANDYDLALTGLGQDRIDLLIEPLDAPSFEDLEDEWGEYDEKKSWPTIKLQVPPETKGRFDEALKACEGDEDYQRLEILLTRAEDNLITSET